MHASGALGLILSGRRSRRLPMARTHSEPRKLATRRFEAAQPGALPTLTRIDVTLIAERLRFEIVSVRRACLPG